MSRRNAVFGVVQGLAVLRIEGRIDERLQAAIRSRLIALPCRFFRDFSAGDLADRAGSIGAVREMLTGAAVQAAVSGLFSMFSLLLLFFYSWRLALIASAMLFAMAIATALCSYRQFRHYREMFRTRGAISGFAFQMINGLSKLRVADAATYALARWARQFAEQKQAALAARRWAAVQHAAGALEGALADLRHGIGDDRVRALVVRALRRLSLVGDLETETRRRREEEYRLPGEPVSMNRGRRVRELPSVALTLRFLPLCKGHGSRRVAVQLVILGHNSGEPGVPGVDDWTAWDADQMRAAVDYLERIR